MLLFAVLERFLFLNMTIPWPELFDRSLLKGLREINSRIDVGVFPKISLSDSFLWNWL